MSPSPSALPFCPAPLPDDVHGLQTLKLAAMHQPSLLSPTLAPICHAFGCAGVAPGSSLSLHLPPPSHSSHAPARPWPGLPCSKACMAAGMVHCWRNAMPPPQWHGSSSDIAPVRHICVLSHHSGGQRASPGCSQPRMPAALPQAGSFLLLLPLRDDSLAV